MFGASHTVPLCSATMVTTVLLSNIVVLVSWILSLNLTASLNTCKVSQQLRAPKGMQVMHWKWNKIVWYKPYKYLYLLYTIIVVYYVSILLPAYFMWIASFFLQLDDYLLHWFSDIHCFSVSIKKLFQLALACCFFYDFAGMRQTAKYTGWYTDWLGLPEIAIWDVYSIKHQRSKPLNLVWKVNVDSSMCKPYTSNSFFQRS